MLETLIGNTRIKTVESNRELFAEDTATLPSEIWITDLIDHTILSEETIIQNCIEQFRSSGMCKVFVKVHANEHFFSNRK
jgi:hypothetical protein